ncbi:hypothetical protein BYT27DRAFT_7190879 [Phlegmacium glaucopus]|nr:hypothetical protein BYT27DRAFT_7190879 [Phlegmacium glaucopus]
MQAELVHHQHQQQQQRSTTNHYLNLSVPYPVPLSASNYHHLSDPNNTNGNTIGGDSTDIIDFHGSDSASHSSCSVPSSAASSSVHLPLAMNANVAIVDSISARRRRSLLAGGGGAYDNNGALLIPDRAATSSTSSSSSSHHHDHRQNQNAFQQSKHVPFSTHDQNALSSNHHHHQHHHHRQHQHQPHPHSHPQPQPQPHHHHLQQMISVGDNLGRPEFSSAFGLLSLDDPNVMAGISTDGTPFFDDPGQAHNQPRSNTSGSTTVLGDAADMDTPMPLKQDSGQLQLLSLGGSASSSGQRFPMPTSSTAGAIVENGSPLSKERDAKELKEFWKQYMRIPLSGSGVLSSGGSEGISPSGGIGNKSTTNAPVPGPAGYRRPRVASLPTVKTPIVERDRDHFNLGFANAIYQNQILQPSISTSTSYASNPDLRRSSHEMPGMGMDMDMSMSIGDTEDLRSYEAAVMARKAPTTLNLKVRRPMRGRGRARGGGGVPDSGTGDKSRDEGSVSASSRNSPGAGGGDTITSSDCSSSSSLANAFGTGRRRPSHSRDKTLLASGGGRLNSSATFGRLLFPAGSSRSAIDPIKKEESSSPSLSSPASSSDFEGEAGDQSDMGGPSPLIGGNLPRPSFKRLPSQTLGPDNPKRPFYGFGGEDSMEDRSVGGWGVGGGGDVIDDDDGLIEKRDVLVGVSIAERRRRMSEPSTTGSGAVGNFEREGKRKQNNEKSSRGDVSAVQNVDEAMVS